jgi:hypothetical protein
MKTASEHLKVTCQFHFKRAPHGQLEMQHGEAPAPPPAPAGRVPRISRLMALAIRFDDLLRRGEVKDYAELARLGHVTRARATQIMNLLNLAADIQEEILCLAPVERGRDPIKEWQVRPVSATASWTTQRKMWRHLTRSSARPCWFSSREGPTRALAR